MDGLGDRRRTEAGHQRRPRQQARLGLPAGVRPLAAARHGRPRASRARPAATTRGTNPPRDPRRRAPLARPPSAATASSGVELVLGAEEIEIYSTTDGRRLARHERGAEVLTIGQRTELPTQGPPRRAPQTSRGTRRHTRLTRVDRHSSMAISRHFSMAIDRPAPIAAPREASTAPAATVIRAQLDHPRSRPRAHPLERAHAQSRDPGAVSPRPMHAAACAASAWRTSAPGELASGLSASRGTSSGSSSARPGGRTPAVPAFVERGPARQGAERGADDKRPDRPGRRQRVDPDVVRPPS